MIFFISLTANGMLKDSNLFNLATVLMVKSSSALFVNVNDYYFFRLSGQNASFKHVKPYVAI